MKNMKTADDLSAVLSFMIPHREWRRRKGYGFLIFLRVWRAASTRFVGAWLAPCQAIVDGGTYPGPCDHPNAMGVTETHSLFVTFSP